MCCSCCCICHRFGSWGAIMCLVLSLQSQTVKRVNQSIIGGIRRGARRLAHPSTPTTEQHYTVVVVAVLMVPFPFPDRDDQPPFPVRRNGTWMPYSSQDSMQPTDHGPTSCFEPLRTDVTNASCLSTPQLCHRLFDFIKRGCSFVNGWISIHHL